MTTFPVDEVATWVERAPVTDGERTLIETYINPALPVMEGGVGGGRLLLGTTAGQAAVIHGFDLHASAVEAAMDRLPMTGAVQDATELGYRSGVFPQLIYMCGFLSLVDDAEKAASEAHRVLQPGGRAVFTVMAIEERLGSCPHRLLFAWLAVVRAARGRRDRRRMLPWLRVGGRPNYWSLLDGGPHSRWFTQAEIRGLLEHAGFHDVTFVRAAGERRPGHLVACVA